MAKFFEQATGQSFRHSLVGQIDVFASFTYLNSAVHYYLTKKSSTRFPT